MVLNLLFWMPSIRRGGGPLTVQPFVVARYHSGQRRTDLPGRRRGSIRVSREVTYRPRVESIWITGHRQEVLGSFVTLKEFRMLIKKPAGRNRNCISDRLF